MIWKSSLNEALSVTSLQNADHILDGIMDKYRHIFDIK